MSQQQKAAYFRALKKAGVQFTKHYREYTEAELKTNFDALVKEGVIEPGPVTAETKVTQAQPSLSNKAEQVQAQREQHPAVPVVGRNPDEMPSQRLNTQAPDRPIRIDPETGREVYQEEVLKPGYAKPRGRRVLRSMEPAAVKQTIQNGDYVETFEVAGSGPKQATEVKITMPSYQTGIVKDPRFPFKIHTYNGVEGFDFFEVAEYYGGADLVPPSCKRMYVENVLCYDMRSVIQTINAEFRQLQLAGRIKA